MIHYIIIELAPLFPILFFGIGLGPSSQEKQQFGQLGSLASFATSQGEGDISTADNFWKSILSGDPSKISQVLGPQTSSINKQAQQQKQTAAQFGTRSGGTDAAQQMAGDDVRNTYQSLVSSLTGDAASALGASGSSLLSAGVSAHEGAFTEANTIQQQHQAQINDLFKSIVSVAAAPFTGGASLDSLGTGGSKLSLSSFGGGGPGEDPTSFNDTPAI